MVNWDKDCYQNPTIKFTHDYPKLRGQVTGKLYGVDITEKRFLSDEFIEYDTTINANEKYSLPDGKLIMLTFLGDKFIPFTTLRRFEREKYEYYLLMRDRIFKLLVKGRFDSGCNVQSTL